MNPKPIIVISATRFFQGGALIIVNECLKFLSCQFSSTYTIKALVYKKELYEPIPDIEWVEFPHARGSVFNRLYNEYIYFGRLAKKWQPVLWLSLQDSTPRVTAAVRAVYYHNTLLIKPKSLQLWRHQPRLELLRLLYKYVYTRGIANNDFIITQQAMLADYLVRAYRLDREKLRIFPPATNLIKKGQNNDPVWATAPEEHNKQTTDRPYTFIYPATAFYYKNHALIIDAVRILASRGLHFRVWLTIDGTENKYVKKLVQAAKKELPQIQFLGFLKRETLFNLYTETDYMVFPSLLESWGLPLTEFASFRKPILCADLPYGRSTLYETGYQKVTYFDPTDPRDLALKMETAIQGKLEKFEKPGKVDVDPQYSPTMDHYKKISTWAACFDALLGPKK